MNDDATYQVIKLLADSVLLDIPIECKKGVLKNTEILHQYSRFIHQFTIPEIKGKEGLK